MQVKVFEANKLHQLEPEINAFIKTIEEEGKEIIDIKYACDFYKSYYESRYSAMIVYE